MVALELGEIRTLDGPNIFLLAPAIKLQFGAPELSARALDAARERWRVANPERVASDTTDADERSVAGLLWVIVRDLHTALGLPVPDHTTTRRDLPGRAGWRDLTLAFGWEWRTAAEGIAEAAFAALGDLLAERPYGLPSTLARLREALTTDRAENDRPLCISDAARRIPVAAITGTNGKTTTTRCLAHLLAATGRRVGMANSNGVWIGDEQVLEGDYTGPQGARRVLDDPAPEVAVLETARGGILLRGTAYESADVGVVTNISGDHLGLQGIDTLEGLAGVKSVVVRLTRPAGLAVLNADDPLVRAMAAVTRAPVLFFSREPDDAPVREHLAAGGRALLAERGAIVLAEGAARRELVPLAEVPITFGGRAGHMVENALAAAGAALGLGLDPAIIADGLRTFRNSPDQNFGRLNAFAIDEPACTFIVDYAHNEAGLRHLLAFGREFVAPGARLLAIIGTAGDRTDENLRGIGELAGAAAEFVWIHETEHYLRGRERAEMNDLFLAGIAAGIAAGHNGATDRRAVVPDELAAVEAALAFARPGDAIVMMCFEEQAAVLARLDARGTLLS